MYRELNVELLRIALITAVALVLGLLIGYPISAVALGLALYLAWVVSQIVALANWIAREPSSEPPTSSGIFEFIFERLFRQRRDQLRRETRLREEMKRYTALIRDVRDGVVLLEADGTIAWFNTQAQKLLGLVAGRDERQPLTHFVRAPEFISYLNKREFTEPLKLVSPRRPERWLEFSVTLYGDGECLLLIRDITRMQRLEFMRRDFVANLSHELRTPLTVLRGYLETLQTAELEAPVRRALDEMEHQSDRMSSLLQDLTMLSRLESVDPPEHPQWHSLDGQIRQICGEARQFDVTGNVRFELDLDEHLAVRGDATELYSAFANLVVNAVKYAASGGEIRVSWQVVDGCAEFSVSDDGPGIEVRHIPRLTERFYRVDSSRNSATGGTGLGLAIVKHVLLRHEAELQIDSRLGRGSTFTCRFPQDRTRRSAPDADSVKVQS